MDIRKGTTITIIAGKDKGKQGTVERVLASKKQVVVSGLNLMKRHIKPNSKYPSGGIIEMAYPLDQSNVKVVDADTEKAAKPAKKAK